MIESAWPKYPGYAIDLFPLDGVGRVRLGDTLVAESSQCLIMRESDHVDQLYFPRDDVDADLLVDSDHHTICPFKGEASYHGLSIAGQLLDNVVWWYPSPMDEVAGLETYLAFYSDRVKVTVSVLLGDGDEATVQMPIWGTAEDLATLVDVVPGEDGSFIAPTYPDPPLGTFLEMRWHKERRNVIEGGQLLGAAIVGAAKTRPEQRVTSAHMAFMRAASFDRPLEIGVDARRSGSTLSVFDVMVTQEDKLRATALVMSDIGASDLIRHAAPMPDVPPPGACPPLDFKVLGRETRVVDGADQQDPDSVGPPELLVWTRFAGDPGPQHLHQALLAQSTTHYSIGAALRPHRGITERDAHVTVSMGPVNATIAFHDEVDVSAWYLTETRSIWAGRGSTQSQVRVFTADGRLVASKAVQAIVRIFDRTPEQMGRDYSSAM
jgi:uncharacterized protein (DUF427 family)/acyl-CoA thioesterase